MDHINLLDPLESTLVGPGKRFVKHLKRMGIQTVKDLLWHFPARYEDRSEFMKIADMQEGEEITIKGIVQKANTKRIPYRKLVLTDITIADEDGDTLNITFFNQPYIENTLKVGKVANFSGKVTKYKGRLTIQSPIYELTESRGKEKETQHTGRLVPTYHETKGLTSRGLRFMIKHLLDNLEALVEYIPEEILKKQGLPDVNEAIQDIHFPKTRSDALKAIESFAFRDLFLLQLRNALERRRIHQQSAYSIKAESNEIKELLSFLPFELTFSQRKSLNEILEDIEKGHPMNRLLQGDVGSGKTIIAGIAALLTARRGFQSVFMAPTEILAHQHYQTLIKFFEEYEGGIALLTAKEAKIFYGTNLEAEFTKPGLIKQIKLGKVGIIVGTHALIQKKVGFNNLAFVVIDEQHRFGVTQRASLTKEEDVIPHFLSMSSTPIPRTLTMTIFGNLDISLINELPRGRKPITTKIVEPQSRNKAYDFIEEQIKEGRQVFVICPRIEESEADEESESAKKAWSVKAVKIEYEKLSKEIFPDLNIDMLHGKMKVAEKKEAMENFTTGKTDILVSTSVVEVGVDIPNATIMMIEGADRFGLAQLYQFRGRVGRGEHQSYCLLFTDSKSNTTYERLHSLVQAKNGFELAEMDLKLRGPGEFLGETQTGMPDIALKALQNPQLLKSAKEIAEKIIDANNGLDKYPLLVKKLDQFRKKIHLE